MSTQISRLAFAPALLLAACAPESGAPEGESVECALSEEAAFAEECVLERAGKGAFTIHHPDATFQRIRYDATSGVLTSADGANDLVMDPDPSAGTLEFSVGNARYRIARAVLTAPTP